MIMVLTPFIISLDQVKLSVSVYCMALAISRRLPRMEASGSNQTEGTSVGGSQPRQGGAVPARPGAYFPMQNRENTVSRISSTPT
jgi:hypothetical protein